MKANKSQLANLKRKKKTILVNPPQYMPGQFIWADDGFGANYPFYIPLVEPTEIRIG